MLKGGGARGCLCLGVQTCMRARARGCVCPSDAQPSEQTARGVCGMAKVECACACACVLARR